MGSVYGCGVVGKLVHHYAARGTPTSALELVDMLRTNGCANCNSDREKCHSLLMRSLNAQPNTLSMLRGVRHLEHEINELAKTALDEHNLLIEFSSRNFSDGIRPSLITASDVRFRSGGTLLRSLPERAQLGQCDWG